MCSIQECSSHTHTHVTSHTLCNENEIAYSKNVNSSCTHVHTSDTYLYVSLPYNISNITHTQTHYVYSNVLLVQKNLNLFIELYLHIYYVES